MIPLLACPDPRDLQRLSLGQLPEEEAARLAQHILECAACAERLNAFHLDDPLVADLRAAGQSLPTVAGADLLADRLVRIGPADSGPAPTLPGASGIPGEGPPPANLGRYQIVGHLGTGGMGVVLRAHDPQLGRDVAIKLPTFRGSAEERASARQRFLREARAGAAIRHAHVCPIYDVGEEQGRPYVVMAFIDGETLAGRLGRLGRFEEPREAVALLLRVADALAAIHAVNIVHRDLKPGNILLDRAGQPFLADFGLARSEGGERLTGLGQLVGTPAYMAPEQAATDLGPVGPWSDQYSLAVVLYELLTGRLPFEGSATSLFLQLVTAAAPPPSRHRPDLDPQLDAICLRALEKQPAARFGSIREFATALERYLRPDIADNVTPQPALRNAPLPTRKERQASRPSSAGDEASRLSLAARYYLEGRNEEGVRKGIALYTKILDMDPTFAPAWAGLATSYHLLGVRGYASPSTVCPKARSAAQRAIELDSSLGEAHTALASIRMEYDWDLVGAEQVFRQTLELDPEQAYAHQLYGKCLACMGRHDESIAALRRGEALDPLSRTVGVSVARHGYLLARRYDEAVEQLRKTLQTDPDFWLAHRFLGWAYLFQGRHAAALAAFETARRLYDSPVTLVCLGYVHAVSGQPEKAHEALADLAGLAQRRYITPDDFATLHIALGDRDQAFAWLQRAVADRSEWLCKIAVDPILDPLRSDPRFEALLRLVNRGA